MDDTPSRPPARGDPGASLAPRFPDDEIFRRLVDDVVDYAIFILDVNGFIVSWNKGAQRIKGYAADEIIGQHFSVFYTDEARARGWPQEELRRTAELGRFEDEGWRVRKDGSQFWANIVLTALHGADGEVDGFAKITRDLTQRRAREERLRENEESLRLMIEGMRDQAIFPLDPEGRIVGWNAGAQRLLGYSADEALGQRWTLFCRPADLLAGRPQRALSLAASTGTANQTGWRVRRDGTRFWAEVTLTALRHTDGTLRGFVKITRDRSERRRLRRLETEGRRINEFIAMLGHELRNPLAPIRNAVGILEKTPLPADVARARQLISRQVDHMARIVDDLLDVSRITRGKLQLDKRRLDLCELVTATVESVRPAVTALDQALGLQVPDEPLVVFGDATRLSQVLVNLLNNAAKYTPRGGRIDVALRRQDDSAVVSVRDTGAGMSPQLIERAFDLFEQGDRTLDRTEGGLGIGLTLVKRMVTLHGGEVRAASAGLGHGTEFIVSLPLARAASPAPAPASPPPATPAAVGPARHVLVVDDNRDAADSLAELLRLSGYVVAVARSGAEALRAATEAVPDVVILDIGLPGMDGYEVARRMRDLPALAATRLVAMTGYGQPGDRERARAAGFEAHLVKPVDYTALLALLERGSD